MEFPQSVNKFREASHSMGFSAVVHMLDDHAATAQQAADALGCTVGQIAKSIVFRIETTGAPLLVVASGANRVDVERVADLVQDRLGKADAAFVRESTGYAIGGVPPLGHTQALRTIIDEELYQYLNLWAAAGHPKAVFAITARELQELTGGTVAAVREG